MLQKALPMQGMTNPVTFLLFTAHVCGRFLSQCVYNDIFTRKEKKRSEIKNIFHL